MDGDLTNRSACGRRRLIALGTLAVVSVYAAHGLTMILRSSFVIDGRRYFCLFDDAMISLTYARNWANGHGIVWNVDEQPVEGYTNFGWVAVMAAVHLLGLTKIGVCLAMQVLGLVLGCACVVGAARLGRALEFSPGGIVLSAVLVGASYHLKYFSVLGAEQSLLALLYIWSAVLAVSCLTSGRVRGSPFVPLALGAIVRPDTPISIAVLTMVLFAACHRARWRSAVYGMSAMLLFLVHLWWRHGYYGEWVPNTYYTKVVGWPFEDRLRRGIVAGVGSVRRMLLPLLIVVVGLFGRKSAPAALILGTFGALLVYQTWVGGDAWPRDRFLCPATPAVLVLTAGALDALFKRLSAAEGRVRGARWMLTGGLAFGVVACINQDVWREASLLTPPMYTADNAGNLSRGFAIEDATTEDAVIGLYWAGSVPYFVERTYLDFLGKSDKTIAHMPVRLLSRVAPPGHMKFSWKYAIGERQPDVVTRCDGMSLLHARSFQERYWKVRSPEDMRGERTFWIRKDSRRLEWSGIRLCSDYDVHDPTVSDDPP